MTGSEKNRRYATIMHPTIGAVLAGTYRFANEEQAKQQLQIFRDHFVLSRQQNEEAGDQGIILWIKGYALTPEEKADGYTGNYALVGMVKRSGGKFSLQATKLESELKFHPQRQRPKHKHPNWGHPILRSVKKKRVYPTLEEAQAELQLLHEEYPQVTIPLTNKLYVILYSRQQNPPAQKYVMEIKVDENGGFYIDAYVNEYKPAQAVKAQPTQHAAVEGEEGMEESMEAAEATPPATGGYFTSMVALKRSKKKKPIGAAALVASRKDAPSKEDADS